MEFVPHSYQKYASEYIKKNKNAAIFLDMGLGKTVITLSAINDLMLDEFSVSKVLVVAPLRVAKTTWKDEVGKWDHLKNLKLSVVVGDEKERLKALKEKSHIYVINRENVEWLVNLNGFDFDMVVIDELSSFKSHKAKRFKSLATVRGKVKRIVGLTGTPSSNSLMDLWAQFRLLDMGERLERYISHYREKYFMPDKRNGAIIYSYKLKPGAEDEIYRKIEDMTISMRARDYLKLPDCILSERVVEMERNEKEKYREFKKEMIATFGEKEIDVINAAALSNKLLQMTNGTIYDEDKNYYEIHNKKLDALEDLIEEANGKPVLIAYWFKSDRERIMKRFKGKEIKTDVDIKNWNSGKIPVALIHPASAGHGLNLQFGGSILIWFGLTWSLELYQQTNARLHRQGQKEVVSIVHIITKGTIDEDVMKALKRKDKTQEALIDAVRREIQ